MSERTFAFVALATLAASLSCSKGRETSLREVVTWEGFSVDQLELAVVQAEGGPRGTVVVPTLRPERATGALTSPADVIIRVRDELDGAAVKCRASALWKGALQQYAESEPVTVRKGGLVACTVAVGAGTVAVNLPNGAPCGVDRQCASRACVDGLCCDSRCDAACMACDLPTSPGICAFIPDGAAPRDAGQCRASAASTCGTDGMCDGHGACRTWPAGTSCGEGRCDGASIVGARACNGRGTCEAAPLVTCAPFLCDPAASPPRCRETCGGDADCVSGRACVGGSCGRRADGAACGADADCQSGHCADGVCCDGPCDGACRSCAQAGLAGKCRPVAEGAPDPHAVCSDARGGGDVASCGTTGTCDGLGGCAVYAAETLCGVATCSTINPSIVMKAGTCDGAGACQPGGTLRCSPFACTEGRCKASCDDNGDCAPGQVCDTASMSCGLKGAGQPCEAGTECESGVCADGVCCNEACSGPCRSCALPSSMGVCKNTAMGSADPHGVCKPTDVATCGQDGTCDGAGACRRYLPGTVCAPMTCAGAMRKLPGRCNDQGACVAGDLLSCAPYKCNGGGCFVSCSGDGDCDPPNVCRGGACAPKPVDMPCSGTGGECGSYACRNGACVTTCAGDGDCTAPATCVGTACRKRALGATCTAGAQCESANCVDGVCCSAASCDACKACNVPGFLGACANVPAGVTEPHARCAPSAAATCGLDGACNGAGACRKWGPATVCAPAVCSMRKKSDNPKTCDGNGACVPRGMPANCAPDDCDPATGACP